ncbi:hypothetical protein PCC7424_5672 (plasmid) [Gloeothece citriformis PCC 7424]|uniref:Uncharacterized protein n=1 Tax=Gloeothece citriformis (strain PCC 7424) TaxID=65393 RepID=B7KLR7_GLOC7|nr:single-stranded DNA-binding protein [Gloeothece citriformis]ACK73739.1 hypothetical protein PCC7424_5672 [Gloeothece citriformis PCC 7424]
MTTDTDPKNSAIETLLNPVVSIYKGTQNLWVLLRDVKNLLNRQNQLLEKNNELLEQLLTKEITSNTEEFEPNFKAMLNEYKNFDWDTIEARVISSDGEGVTVVQYRGKVFERRRSSVDDVKGAAIWFSSATKTPDGKVKYLKLITFREKSPIRPLHGEIKEQLQ